MDFETAKTLCIFISAIGGSIAAITGLLNIFINWKSKRIKIYHEPSSFRRETKNNEQTVKITISFRCYGEESFNLNKVLFSFFNPSEERCPKPEIISEDGFEHPPGDIFGYSVNLPANRDVEYILAFKVNYKSTEPLFWISRQKSRLFLFKCNPGNLYPEYDYQKDNPYLEEIKDKREYQEIYNQLPKDFY